MYTYTYVFKIKERSELIAIKKSFNCTYFFSGLLMSITLPCYDNTDTFIGVAGTDINIEDLLSDITFFNQGQTTYAFMIGETGRTLIHPLLPAPTDAYEDPIFMDIRTLEPESEFLEVFDSMTK